MSEQENKIRDEFQKAFIALADPSLLTGIKPLDILNTCALGEIAAQLCRMNDLREGLK